MQGSPIICLLTQLEPVTFPFLTLSFHPKSGLVTLVKVSPICRAPQGHGGGEPVAEVGVGVHSPWGWSGGQGTMQVVRLQQ